LKTSDKKNGRAFAFDRETTDLAYNTM